MISEAKKSSGAVENCATTALHKGLPEGAGQIGLLKDLRDSKDAPHPIRRGKSWSKP